MSGKNQILVIPQGTGGGGGGGVTSVNGDTGPAVVLTPNGIGAENNLAIQALQTTGFTAQVNKWYPVDSTAGTIAIAFPSTPSDGDRVGIKWIAGTNAITGTLAGADVINKTGGVNTFTIALLNDDLVFKYKASIGVWYVTNNSHSVASLDARLAPIKVTTATQGGSSATTANMLNLALQIREIEQDYMPEALMKASTKFQINSPQIQKTTGWTIAGNGAVLTGGSGAEEKFQFRYISFTNPLCAVSIDVNLSSATGATQYAGCGISKKGDIAITPNQNCVWAYWNKVAGTTSLVSTVAGVATTYAGSAYVNATGIFKMLVIINGNTVSLLIDEGFGYKVHDVWKETLSATQNFPANWGATGEWLPYVTAGATVGTITIKEFKAGHPGYLALQSFYYVKYEDGTPITDAEGNYYMNCMGVLPDTNTGQLWGGMNALIFKVNPYTFKKEVVSTMILYRAGQYRPVDGFGPVIFDRTDNTWHYLAQNSSELNVVNAVTLDYTTKENVLIGSPLLNTSSVLVVPTSLPNWDADAVKVGSDWYLSYSQRTANLGAGTFFPVLAKSTTGLHGTYTVLGSYPAFTESEGTHLVRIGGVLYFLTSNGSSFYIFNIPAMTINQTITPTGYSTVAGSKPHFNLMPLNKGDKTHFVVETFNMTKLSGGQSYGEREIYTIPLVAGNEYDTIFKVFS